MINAIGIYLGVNLTGDAAPIPTLSLLWDDSDVLLWDDSDIAEWDG